MYMWRIGIMTITTFLVTISQYAYAEKSFTPDTIIKELKVISTAPQCASGNKAIVAVFAGDNLNKRKIIIEKGRTDYFEGIKITILPGLKMPTYVSYEITVSEEQPSLWHVARCPTKHVTEEEQHVLFVFKVNLAMPADQLIGFLNDYQIKPMRKYEGEISYKIFGARTDKRGVSMEAIIKGAETVYIEIDIDITKIDGKQLLAP